MIKIALFNNKGGVGKTTATINVAHALSKAGEKVLVADCDSQKNTYRFFSDEGNNSQNSATRYENIEVTLDFMAVKQDYDYVLADLPPALDETTKDIVAKCDFVIIPIELGTFAIQGIREAGRKAIRNHIKRQSRI